MELIIVTHPSLLGGLNKTVVPGTLSGIRKSLGGSGAPGGATTPGTESWEGAETHTQQRKPAFLPALHPT